MSRIVRFHELGGPDVLRIEDEVVPEPGPGEVRVQVKAIGLNRAETLFRSGNYIETATLPASLGLEAAGVVEMVGEGVDGFSAGDKVSVIPPKSMATSPSYRVLANFPAKLLVKHPPSLGWQQAAAVWMQYLTAFGGLIDVGGVKSGDFVVITAASSSVGLAAIQVANKVGATPIAVTRTPAKKQALLEAGAAHVIATETENLEGRLKEITGSTGVRVVFDPVGGPIFEPLTAAMSAGGILIEYGGLSSAPTPFPLFSVLSKQLILRGYLVHEVTGDPDRLEAAKAFILEGLASGSLQPIIAETFPLDQIAEAHRYLESNNQLGKIVVTT
jgi:NADPH:quinone reductase-like Zn-dependent oxidoreductase